MKTAFRIFLLFGSIGLLWSVWLVFTGSPLSMNFSKEGFLEGTSLFFNQKIFYFHVAHAFWLFAAVGVAGVCSIAYLVKRKPEWDV